MNTLTQSQIDTKLTSISTNEVDYLSNYFFFETSFTQSNTRSTKARSIFFFANPIEIDGTRFKNYVSDESKQIKKFVDFSKEIKSEIDSLDTNLKVTLYNIVYSNAIAEELILQDFGYILISFLLVLSYVSFHVGSFFLGCLCMIGIGFAFPLSLFINWYIFQISYFSSLQLVSIFIVLGIAADDIFVFTDQWKQSGNIPQLNDQETHEENLLKRMSFTWRRTSKAILTTSLTTAVSYLATGFSKIMPVSAFGYYSATLVLVIYLFAITAYPC